MELFIIILLIVIGLFLVVAEVLLLPGLTVAAIGALAAFVVSVIMTYNNFGLAASFWVLFGTIILAIVTLLLSLRAKTLRKLSLHSTIDSAVSDKAEHIVALGAEGITQTRLAPMGSVLVDGKIMEAKTYDGYVNPRTPVIVTGFENSVVVVSVKNK